MGTGLTTPRREAEGQRVRPTRGDGFTTDGPGYFADVERVGKDHRFYWIDRMPVGR